MVNPSQVGGRRYKVRIVGLHDKEEEAVKSDQLPWHKSCIPSLPVAVMRNQGKHPISAKDVLPLGFFMDGPDQQVQSLRCART